MLRLGILLDENCENMERDRFDLDPKIYLPL